MVVFQQDHETNTNRQSQQSVSTTKQETRYLMYMLAILYLIPYRSTLPLKIKDCNVRKPVKPMRDPQEPSQIRRIDFEISLGIPQVQIKSWQSYTRILRVDTFIRLLASIYNFRNSQQHRSKDKSTEITKQFSYNGFDQISTKYLTLFTPTHFFVIFVTVIYFYFRFMCLPEVDKGEGNITKLSQELSIVAYG